MSTENPIINQASKLNALDKTQALIEMGDGQLLTVEEDRRILRKIDRQ